MERMRFALICLATLPMFACQTPALDPAPPSASFLLAESALPDYEDRLDHAGLIGDSSRAAYGRGQVTYRTTCHSCHGDAATPGSIPSSRRFWSEAFKNGSDPFSQYQTLTRGFGQMPPQVRLTPREKYDVIHFIREEFLKEANPGQHFAITDDWMATLPQGDTLGPDPTPYRPWADMDYGDFLIHTYELANSGDPPRGISGGPSPLPDEDFRDVNFSYKGIAVRLDQGDGGIAAGNAFVLFDHDLLRFTGFWTGEGFMDYEYVLLNGRHNTFPRTVGKIEIENPITPGWANPETGDFEDPRFVAVDGRPFGPLPREWAHYKGLYHHGDRVVIKYTVGDAEVLETYDLERGQPVPVISRTLNISASSTELRMRVAPSQVAVHLVGRDVELIEEDGFHVMVVPAGTGVAVKLWMSGGEGVALQEVVSQGGPPEDLDQYTHGGPIHYPEVLTTPVVQGEGDGAYVTDVLTLPLENPWKSRMRPTGIDFFDGGRGAVVSTMDGEVWQVDGILSDQGNWLTKLLGSERQQEPSSITWKRIATGLFQPLGIRYHEGDIYVGCRDQIVILRDLNGDGETDFYESFNSDHQVTEHFHEFAMGLQTDDVGNFYYAKSARHARTPLVPQHGTLMRVSPDGSTSDIIANGFRAANGVAINADGSFIVTDQEGHWNPMNRVNWVEEGGFYGNMYGYGAPPDSSDEAMIPPLVWIDQKYDRSPAELMWAESDRWGPLSGHLLSLSYGTGKVFVVMPQTIEGTRQGGIVEMPIPHFPTGIMRGRMNPNDGQLYAVGMSAWATNQN
ncbi:MAG: cytochrome c5, partial [Rhodothermales bacterium]